MKYQFTTVGSTSQTNYYKVCLMGPSEEEGLMRESIVSTPLTARELDSFLTRRLEINPYSCEWHCLVTDIPKRSNMVGVESLDTIARIISNIKPLKKYFCIDGKLYKVDPDKLDEFLKSLA